MTRRTRNPAPRMGVIAHAACQLTKPLTDAQVWNPPRLGSSPSENNEGHSRRDGFVVSQGASY